MKNSILYIVISILTLNSCINYTSVQSARTLGLAKEKEQFIQTRAAVQFVDHGSSFEPDGGYLLPEYVFNKRIKKNMDWGLKIGVDASIHANIKYQFLGNSKSKIAMSIQPEIGTGLFPNNHKDLYNAPINFSAELPLMISYYFNDKTYITTSPKIYNMVTPRGNYNMFSYATGINFGEKYKWTIAYAFVEFLDMPDGSSFIPSKAHTIEIGMKFNFNRNKNGKGFSPSID